MVVDVLALAFETCRLSATRAFSQRIFYTSDNIIYIHEICFNSEEKGAFLQILFPTEVMVNFGSDRFITKGACLAQEILNTPVRWDIQLLESGVDEIVF
jgi:hypothetical protein